MSKGNLFLGFARGKLGDVVFSRQGGQQVARARNRSPKNPQTIQQLLQRVVLKTVGNAYSSLRPVADHSFQGFEGNARNQQRFLSVNIQMLRQRLAELISSNDPDLILSSTEANFAGKASRGVEINDYIISEGSLPSVPWVWYRSISLPQISFPGVVPSGFNPTASYAAFAAALGLRIGDQLTFVWAAHDNVSSEPRGVFTLIDFARIILEPATGDPATTPMFEVSQDVLTLRSPNSRNRGEVRFRAVNSEGGGFVGLAPLPPAPMVLPGEDGVYSAVAFGLITSRNVDGVWARSSEMLRVENIFDNDYAFDLLPDAILSYLTVSNSSKYLNQATL